MHNSKSQSQYLILVGFTLYAGLLGIVITTDPRAGFVFALLPMLAWVTLQYQYSMLVLLLLISPFGSAPYLAQNIMGITGMKPYNLVAGAALLFLLMREGNILHFKDPLEKKTIIFLFVYFMFYTFSFFRSIQNLSLFHQLDPITIPSSVTSYILSFYIKQSLSLIPFLIIIKAVREKTEIESIASVIAGSMFILSCAVIIIGGTHLGEYSQGRSVIRELCEKYFGMHYNGVGAIYVLSGPIILYKALGKNRFWFANFVLAFLAILFIQSRTALLIFCCSSFLLLILLKRTKLATLLAGTIVVAFFFLLPSELLHGLLAGVDKGSPDALLSGRITGLWAPLLSEWLENPGKLFLGAGDHGILTSKLWASGTVFQVMHAHNAFLNFFLDNGIILLSLLIYFIFIYMVAAWRLCKQMDSPLCWTLFVVIVAYLARTLTEGNFFPDASKVLFFPSIALLINLIRIDIYGDHDHQSKASPILNNENH